MKQFLSFVVKESKHILRDRRTMLILFGMPVVMMLLFGFAISTDVRHVRTVVVGSQQDHFTQEIVEALDASEYFDILQQVTTPKEAERLIRDQHADMAVVFSAHFASRRSSIQIIVDGADPNMAQQYANYASQIMAQHISDGARASPVTTKLLYNPQMKSSYNFVPGIMGLLLILVCAMMTSISIVREKEQGTMEVLLVSPIRPFAIVIAKAVPYLVLAFAILSVILLMARYVLVVPLHGSVPAIFAVSGLYIVLALSLGLLISALANTQLAALLMSAMVLLMPCMMLSGMMFPIESMPPALQYLSAIVPPRYYISAMRKLMIMGVDIESAAGDIAVLAVMTALFLGIAILKFKTRLQ